VEHSPLFSELHPRKKQQGAAFLSSAFQTQITVGPMNSKLYFFHYQTCCICILSKTQTQPPKQTLPSANWINHFQYLFFKIKRLSIILKGLSFSLLKALLFIFSHIIIDELCKILYFPIGSSKYFFSSDSVLIKDQLILISYKNVWFKKEGSKWKKHQTKMHWHKLYNFSTLMFFQFNFGVKVYFCYLLVSSWEKRERGHQIPAVDREECR
jgi:hypothetical protein